MCLAAASGGGKHRSPVTLGDTRRQSRVYLVDCKGILTPILCTWVQKSTLLLQNRGHAEVFKKTPSTAKYVTRLRPPSVRECPRQATQKLLFFSQCYLVHFCWILRHKIIAKSPTSKTFAMFTTLLRSENKQMTITFNKRMHTRISLE